MMKASSMLLETEDSSLIERCTSAGVGTRQRPQTRCSRCQCASLWLRPAFGLGRL